MTGVTFSKMVATAGAMEGINSHFNRLKEEYSKSHHGEEPTFRCQRIASGMLGGITVSPVAFACSETRSALRQFPRAASNWELMRNYVRTNPNLGERYLAHAGKSMWQGAALGGAAAAAHSAYRYMQRRGSQD